MWAVFCLHWRPLLLAALVIFVPVGLIETVADGLQEPLQDLDVVNFVDALEIVGAAIVHAIAALLGEVLYTGIVAAAVMAYRRDHEGPLRELLRGLPVARLIVLDVVFGVGVVLGLALFIAPGLVFMTWYALSAPAVKVEHLGLRDSFRRSRDLVRPRFWLVFSIVIPTVLLEQTVSNGVHAAVHEWLGESFLGNWATATATGISTAPFFALAVVVLFFQLRDEREPTRA